MIVVTGAAGFIGSCIAHHLHRQGKDLVLVDRFDREDKEPNLVGLEEVERIDRAVLVDWLEGRVDIQAIVHIGARTDTTEFDYSIFEDLNIHSSQALWRYCAKEQIPFIYASSAATYGDGAFGYKDDHDLSEKLMPLNPYGVSKNEFDKWALAQTSSPPNWYGLKFFNVYGPNEYHKGRMASVIFHAYRQILETNAMKLFRSHNPDFKDGEQLRDFVFVKDVISVIDFLLDRKPANGLYNLGTGKARTFNDLVTAVFNALDLEPQIDHIDTPEDIRDKYQYFTEADMSKLRSVGYQKDFISLEDGVSDYVKNYLKKSVGY